MNAGILELMCHRVSCPRLEVPVPSAELLEKVFQTALRAPDHMLLRPWRYLIIQGEARARLGEIFCDAAVSDSEDLSDIQREKYRAMPLRAPMLIVGIAENKKHKKVPVEEQVISCGVGMAYMLLALQAEGYGGMWRTGPMAKHEFVKQGLGIQKHESLVGFLYLGTPKGEMKTVPKLSVADYFKEWGV